jgi:hypothetical protein
MAGTPEIKGVKSLELLVLFTVIALGAWLCNPRERGLALTWSISANQDGSGGCAVRLEGNRLFGPKGVRTLTDVEVEQIGQALDDGGAWKFKFANAGPRPSLYTHSWIRRGDQSTEMHWEGLALTSHVRLVDALLRSPLGPELHQCIQLARSPMEEQETRRRKAIVVKRRFLECRQEVLLEKVEAQRILPLLEYAYPQVKFETHATMNGFYPTGPRDSVLQIKNDIPVLDRLPFLEGPIPSSLETALPEKSVSYGGWSPRNSHGRFQGSLDLRKALQESRSVRAVPLER